MPLIRVLTAFVAALALCSRPSLAVERTVPSDDWPTIASAVAASSDGDTVVLLEGVLQGPDNRTIVLSDIDLTIRGAGMDATIIDAEGAGKHFRVNGGSLHLEDLTLARGFAFSGGSVDVAMGGAAMVTRVHCTECEAFTIGGALHTVDGSIEAVDSTFTLNRTADGAVASVAGTGVITLDGCVVAENEASAGPLSPNLFFAQVAGTIVIRGCDVRENTVWSEGAVALASGGTVLIEDTHFRDNVRGGTLSEPVWSAMAGDVGSPGGTVEIVGGTIGPMANGCLLAGGNLTMEGVAMDGPASARLVSGGGQNILLRDLTDIGASIDCVVDQSLLVSSSSFGVPTEDPTQALSIGFGGPGTKRFEQVTFQGYDVDVSILGSTEDAGDIDIVGCAFSATAYAGLFVQSSREITILGTTFAGSDRGNVFIDGTTATLAGVTIDGLDSFSSILSCRLDGALTIRDTTITGCTAESEFPTVWLDAAEARVERSRFEGNRSAGSGGAIGVQPGSVVTMLDCVFVGNMAEVSGGAVFVQSDPTIVAPSLDVRGSRFHGNVATNGAAIHVDGATAVLAVASSTFTSNTATTLGGALLSSDGATATLAFVTGAHNQSPLGSDLALVDEGTSATVVGSILVSGGMSPPISVDDKAAAAVVSSSIVVGGWPGEGVVDVDPRFIATTPADVRLRPCSPAIDAGPTGSLPADAEDADLDGTVDEAWPRDAFGAARPTDDSAVADTGTAWPGDPGGAVADLGGAERQPSPCDGDLDGSGTVSFEDLVLVVDSWGPCRACDADVSCDDVVGFFDVLVVLAGWGATCDGITP